MSDEGNRPATVSDVVVVGLILTLAILLLFLFTAFVLNHHSEMIEDLRRQITELKH